jgi:hypothetical protein
MTPVIMWDMWDCMTCWERNREHAPVQPHAASRVHCAESSLQASVLLCPLHINSKNTAERRVPLLGEGRQAQTQREVDECLLHANNDMPCVHAESSNDANFRIMLKTV